MGSRPQRLLSLSRGQVSAPAGPYRSSGREHWTASKNARGRNVSLDTGPVRTAQDIKGRACGRNAGKMKFHLFMRCCTQMELRCVSKIEPKPRAYSTALSVNESGRRPKGVRRAGRNKFPCVGALGE